MSNIGFSVDAAKPRSALDWRELWRYRELLWFLTWRDVAVRYKQTALGVAWAVLQPLVTMIIFTIFFGRLAGMESQTQAIGLPYPVAVFAGLLPWLLFANAVTASSQSVVGSAALVTKVYFPRLIIPLAAIGPGLVDLACSIVALLGLMAVYGTPLTWQLVLAPVFIGLTVMAAAGVGALLAALNVSYRDFRFVVPFMLQVWMFASPVLYPLEMVPAAWRWAYALNPLTGLISGFRGAFLGSPLPWPELAISAVMAGLLLVIGAVQFQRTERGFADVL